MWQIHPIERPLLQNERIEFHAVNSHFPSPNRIDYCVRHEIPKKLQLQFDDNKLLHSKVHSEKRRGTLHIACRCNFIGSSFSIKM